MTTETEHDLKQEVARLQSEVESLRICEQRKIITPEWQLDQHFNQGVSHCVNAIKMRMRL